MNGFSNVAPVTQGDGTVVNFSPERANQWEAGMKTNFFDGKLSATASYYDITVSDILRQDPNRPQFTIQDGGNYSHGVEFSVTASPVRGLNLIASYSHNNSKVVKTDDDAIRGRRPERAGPADLVNGWISYEVVGGAVKGLGFGIGGNYASNNYVINRSTTGIFTIPAYTVLNASVSYETSSYRLALKVNNFTDEEYYKGWSTVNPQVPRNVVLGFSYKF
jgi:iron complex outermembrane receptor protein